MFYFHCEILVLDSSDDEFSVDIPDDLKDMEIDESKIDESVKKRIGNGGFGLVSVIKYKENFCVIKEPTGCRDVEGFVKEARFLWKVRNSLAWDIFSIFLLDPTL